MNDPHVNHFERQDLQASWLDVILLELALIHWKQVCIAAVTAFAAGLLAGWGWM